MTMIGRPVHSGVRILAAVALVLAVMSSPIRPARASQTALSPNHLPRNFAILKFGHTGPFAIWARSSLTEEDSLPSEIEDEVDANIEGELTAAPPPASVSFNRLTSPANQPAPDLVSFAASLVARPLRC